MAKPLEFNGLQGSVKCSLSGWPDCGSGGVKRAVHGACEGRWPACTRTHGDCIQSEGCNALIPYYGTRVFPPTPHALRSTYHDRVACALTEPHSLARTRTNLYPSSLFYCHRITQRYFYPR
jgi:hypothetical protein